MSSAALDKSSAWGPTARTPARASWQDRAELAAMFIRPGDVVCDLGAGAQPLKAALPSGTRYIGVDCVSDIPGTHLADFNTPDFDLPSAKFDVVTALGVLNYMNDLDAFLARLAMLAKGKYFIFTYDFWPLRAKSKGLVVNGISTLPEGVALFSKYIGDIRPVTVLRRRAMFTGVLGEGGGDTAVKQSATKIACRYIRPQEYLAVKLFKVDIIPRWMA